MALYSFSKKLRLCCQQDYKAVFDQTLFKVHQPHFFVLAKRTQHPQGRLGLIVAKKKVKRAHERNRLKRLSRESFRLHQQQLPYLDIVVLAKAGADQVENCALHQQLDILWSKLIRQANKYQKQVGVNWVE